MAEELEHYPSGSWRGLSGVLSRLEQPPARADRIPPADVASANRDMHHFGCRTRYRPDGTPFLLAPGDQDPARPS
jgi:hypothetical protein